MNKQFFFFLLLMLGLLTSSYAQFSAGVMGGVGYSSQRQVSSSPDHISISGVKAVQPVPMVGLYGQLTTKGRRGLVAGLKVQYQKQGQEDVGGRNRYWYLVTTPYVGIRPFGRLEVAAGPELSLLTGARIKSIPNPRNPTKRITGYNVKATYWLNRLGIEGGYSHQNDPFDRVQFPSIGTTFGFYNSYVYAAVKYDLIQKVR